MADPRGPPPLQRVLRRALFEDVGSFYERLGDEGEAFADFARRLGELRPGAVRLAWLGSRRTEALAPTQRLLAALCAPLPVEAAPLGGTALGRAAAILGGGGPAPPAPRPGRELLDVLLRHASGGLLVGATDGELRDEAGRSAAQHLAPGPPTVLALALGAPAEAAVAVLGALGLGPCGFYRCLLNGGPPRLCPVCLRKLGALLGSAWDPAAHLSGMRAWAAGAGLVEEEVWYRERLQVVTESYVEPEAAQQAPQHAPQTAVRRGSPPRLPLAQGPRVRIQGRVGELSALNATYASAGACNGRPAFCAGRLFLYYLPASDAWAIGPSLGSEAVWADCGPARGGDFGQTWRVWDGRAWLEDPALRATTLGWQDREECCGGGARRACRVRGHRARGGASPGESLSAEPVRALCYRPLSE